MFLFDCTHACVIINHNIILSILFLTKLVNLQSQIVTEFGKIGLHNRPQLETTDCDFLKIFILWIPLTSQAVSGLKI